MKLSPVPRQPCDQPDPTATEAVDVEATAKSWRWAVIHFPCLEGVVPGGRIIVVSDKKHIPEAMRKYSDLVLWHEKELALYAEQTDSDVFDERTFIAVNRLKHKTHGWFAGLSGDESSMNGDVAHGSG